MQVARDLNNTITGPATVSPADGVTNYQRAVYRMQIDPEYVTLCMYLMGMEIIEDETCGTAATDCVSKIWYSPSYFSKLTVDDTIFLLSHEVYHKFLNFFPRFERWAARHEGKLSRRELLTIFNKAQDYFINWILIHQWGMTMPVWQGHDEIPDGTPKGLYDPKYTPQTHTTERIADELLNEELQQQQQQPPGQPGSGQPQQGQSNAPSDDGEQDDSQSGDQPADEQGDSDQPADEQEGSDDGEQGQGDGEQQEESSAPGDGEAKAGAGEDVRLPEQYDGNIENKLTEQQIQEIELDNASASHNAARQAAAARGIGEGRGESDPFMQELERSQYRATFGWREMLNRYAESNGPTSHSYSRRSRRNVARNQPIIPGKVGKELGTIVFAIDSSGSTSGAAIEYAMEELQRALDTVMFDRAVVIWCSDGIPEHGVLEYRPGDTVDRRRRKCGGGTHFMPVFERVAKDYPDAAVISYLTDGGVGDYEVNEVNEFWRTRLGMKPIVWGLIDNGWACTDQFIVKANSLGLGKVCKLPMEKLR